MREREGERHTDRQTEEGGGPERAARACLAFERRSKPETPKPETMNFKQGSVATESAGLQLVNELGAPDAGRWDQVFYPQFNLTEFRY